MEFRTEKYVFSYLIPRISERTNQNVGDFRKNVGVFPKNVGDFLKNVGEFLKNVGVFWGVCPTFSFFSPFSGAKLGIFLPYPMRLQIIYKERHPEIK